ncbi:phosphatidylinositol-specific phospholipase C1-like protein [Flavobacterium sp.]|uniref:phosphatidylinositol-specific phospholipase C1-like protein n=1 Tax=Flavobacterium sp. TaxID=239 RepID=UPI003A8FBCC7
MKSLLKPILFGMLAAPLFSAIAQDNNTPINKIQVIGSHNSYKIAIESNLLEALAKLDTTNSVYGLQYEHIAIEKQLDMGLRNLEIDIHADSEGGKYAHPKGLDFVPPVAPYDPDRVMTKPGFKVFHIPDIDFRSQCMTFEDCLTKLRKWSEAHPDHVPVFITLEPKDGDITRFGTQPEKFTTKLFNEMDSILFNVLGRDKIITPDMVKGNYATLEEAVLHDNWPKLKDARGKFLFILDNNGDKRDLYMKGHPSLKGRAVFVNAEPGTPEAAWLFRNEPDTDTDIKDLVKKGYIIRTRADAGTTEARNNDYSRFEKACSSGAQIITTDYYLPSKLFKSTYHISFKNNTFVRSNPVTGNTK